MQIYTLFYSAKLFFQKFIADVEQHTDGDNDY